MSLELRVLDLGERDYSQVERIQEELSIHRANGDVPDTLIVAEHAPTVTIGTTPRINVVHASPKELTKKGIKYFESRRGGGATYLGPGQLVFYPVISLRGLKVTIPFYLRGVEKVSHYVAKSFGISTEIGKIPNPTTGKDYNGVWFYNGDGKPHKFFAQGYRFGYGMDILNKGGFSLYVDRRAHEHFDLINHCGFELDKVPPISFEEMISYVPDRKLVIERVLEGLRNVFGYSDFSNVAENWSIK